MVKGSGVYYLYACHEYKMSVAAILDFIQTLDNFDMTKVGIMETNFSSDYAFLTAALKTGINPNAQRNRSPPGLITWERIESGLIARDMTLHDG